MHFDTDPIPYGPDGKTFVVVFAGDKDIATNAPVTANTYLIDDHVGSEDPTLVEQQQIEAHLAQVPPGSALIFDYAEYNPITLELLTADCRKGSARWQTLQTIAEFNELCPRATTLPIKTSTYNFCINKLRPNRIKLMESLHEYETSTYSFCAQITLVNKEPRYYESKYSVHTEFNAINNTSEPNALIYDRWLRDNVFEPSIISFITEPMTYQNSTFYSEKTFFAYEGFTIPIWYGGYGIPEYMRKVGFDIFDDIIDHSYSTLEDPQERMDAAFSLNKHLLDRPDELYEFYNNNAERFWYNYNLNRDLEHNLQFVECMLRDNNIRNDEIKLAMQLLVHNYLEILIQNSSALKERTK